MENYMELTMDSDVFGNVKSNFNAAIQAICKTITEKNLEAADISLAMHIDFEESAEAGALTPKFTHKIVCTFKAKSQVDGVMYPAKMKLSQLDGGEFVLVPIVDPQGGLFDDGTKALSEGTGK